MNVMQNTSMDIHLSKYRQGCWVLEASPCIPSPRPNKDHLVLRPERDQLGAQSRRLSNEIRVDAGISYYR